MTHAPYSLDVLVGGKSITKYEHQGSTFVEGRPASEFEVEFRNNSKGRVLVVPSVDGISTLNGETATPESPGYVVAAGATLRIPGWTIDGASASRFQFQDRVRAYATASQPNSTNVGVVGVIVYKENVKSEQPAVVRHIHHHYPKPTTPWVDPVDPFRITPYIGSPGTPGIGKDWYYSNQWHAPTPLGAVDLNMSVKGMVDLDSSSFRASSTTVSVNNVHVTNSATTSVASSDFELGTGWGARTKFETNQVQFDRGDFAEQLVIYYDSRRNLEKRGIEITRIRRDYVNQMPSPFTTVGCKPPPGWKG